MHSKSHVEAVKESSRGLRGTLDQELGETSPSFSKDSTHLLKFHGIYQQEDRDQREQSRATGQKSYEFMVRTKFPGGGRLSPEDWQLLDAISDRFANGTLRITTRQDLQFHGVGKGHLKDLIAALDSIKVSTWGACGDGARNTVACPLTSLRHHDYGDYDPFEWAGRIVNHLSFRSRAYYEIWLDGEKLPLDSAPEEEPLYGKAYLPRKFKIAFAHVHDNCSDVFTQDLGIVPVLQQGHLAGFQLLAGGGMGKSYGDRETFPRLGEPLALVAPADLLAAIATVIRIQSDFGDRSNRKHARLKYLIEEWGVERVRQEMEARLGRAVAPAGPIHVHNDWEHHGWQKQRGDGDLYFLGLSVPSGRISDTLHTSWKSGLRQVIDEFQPTVWLTPRQDLFLSGIAARDRERVNLRLKDFGIPLPEELAPLRLTTLACPALPTCGVALAEAERILPSILDGLEARGLAGHSIELRISGCPNGCSRTPVAELAFMGRAPNLYNVYAGGSSLGNRLAYLLFENVPGERLTDVAAEIIEAHRGLGRAGESFGDFSWRIGAERLRQLIAPAAAVGQ